MLSVLLPAIAAAAEGDEEPPALVVSTDQAPVVTKVMGAIDTGRTSSGLNLDSAVLQRLPTSRTYPSLARLAPGVAGGGNPNVHGETLYSNSHLLDGMNITDPVTHTFSANVNFDAIESVEIVTGIPRAECGQTTGAIIDVVTKSGGNELSADTSVHVPASRSLRDFCWTIAWSANRAIARMSGDMVVSAKLLSRFKVLFL